MKKVLLVVHQESSDPGRVGQLLQAQGYTLDTRCPSLGDPLPETMDDHAAAIIFGGPMSANDCQTLPFIRTELDWISIALESGKPYLGICLGAQLLARVLGATVSPHPTGVREIGYVPIEPTPDGAEILSGLTHVYHWHKEGFEIPREAVALATGQVFANQAFRYGTSAYGVQFHPEITADMIDLWTTNAADQLVFPGAQSREEQFKQHSHHAASVEAWLKHFLQHWLQNEQQLAA